MLVLLCEGDALSDLTNAEKRDRDLLQAGFVKGAEWYHRNRRGDLCMADSLAAAKLAYPDTYEPTIVTLENGEFAQFHCGKLRRRSKPDIPWQLTSMTPHECLALAEAAKEAIAHEYSERTK